MVQGTENGTGYRDCYRAPRMVQGTENGTGYREVLKQFLIPIQFSKKCPNDMLLHQDGVPLPVHISVQDFLNREFPRKWTRRASPILSPLFPLTLQPLISSSGRT